MKLFRKKLCAALVAAGAAACRFAGLAQPSPKSTAGRTLVRAGHLLDVKTGKLLG